MTELLHDVDALGAIATDFPEPARSWARRLLHLWHPAAASDWPLAGDLEPLLAARPGATAALTEALGQAPASADVARAVALLPHWGHRPSSALHAAVAKAVDEAPDGHPALPWLALALAGPDGVPDDALRAAATARTADAALLVPAVALLASGERGAETATALFSRMDDAAALAVLGILGVPEALIGAGDPPDEVARRALEQHGDARALPRVKGSRKRRAEGLVHALLDGRDDPMAHALRAFVAGRRATTANHAVAHAAWLAAFTPSDDPVGDVCDRHGALHPDVLAAAVDALTDDDLPRVRAATRHLAPRAGLLLLRLDPASAAPNLLELGRLDTHEGRVLCCAAAPHLAPHIPELLSTPLHRNLGLDLATWAPTDAVLVALVHTPVPAVPAARLGWARALASTGDPLGAEHVLALHQHGEDTGSALDLVQALGLGR